MHTLHTLRNSDPTPQSHQLEKKKQPMYLRLCHSGVDLLLRPPERSCREGSVGISLFEARFVCPKPPVTPRPLKKGFNSNPVPSASLAHKSRNDAMEAAALALGIYGSASSVLGPPPPPPMVSPPPPKPTLRSLNPKP